jgi:hypothetical protein
MSTTQRQVEATLIDDSGREVEATLTCVLHNPPMGLQDWLGMGWADARLTPGDYTLRDAEGNESRILVNNVTSHSGRDGSFTTVEFRGNGAIPEAWLQ